MSILAQPKILTGKSLTEAIDIRTLPKVLLHEHLDGGLRPTTVIDLAVESSYQELPTTDPGDLAKWFHRGAQRGNLTEYLEGFRHTIAVMQTPRSPRAHRLRVHRGHVRRRRGVCRGPLRPRLSHCDGAERRMRWSRPSSGAWSAAREPMESNGGSSFAPCAT